MLPSDYVSFHQVTTYRRLNLIISRLFQHGNGLPYYFAGCEGKFHDQNITFGTDRVLHTRAHLRDISYVLDMSSFTVSISLRISDIHIPSNTGIFANTKLWHAWAVVDRYAH